MVQLGCTFADAAPRTLHLSCFLELAPTNYTDQISALNVSTVVNESPQQGTSLRLRTSCSCTKSVSAAETSFLVFESFIWRCEPRKGIATDGTSLWDLAPASTTARFFILVNKRVQLP